VVELNITAGVVFERTPVEVGLRRHMSGIEIIKTFELWVMLLLPAGAPAAANVIIFDVTVPVDGTVFDKSGEIRAKLLLHTVDPYLRGTATGVAASLNKVTSVSTASFAAISVIIFRAIQFASVAGKLRVRLAGHAFPLPLWVVLTVAVCEHVESDVFMINLVGHSIEQSMSLKHAFAESE
jgi:hypothetical protein